MAKKAKSIQNIKGMPDILPSVSGQWQYLEKTLADMMAGYGYREIRMPIVESTDLFKRSIGEVTDIVEKEMYTFSDRNNESLTLRPEGTAGCVRAALQNGLLDNQAQQRLWYQGPMFRYEKPQKGRQRQFNQMGVETFGIATPDIDAELITIAWRFLQKLGLTEHVKLEINSIGSLDARNAFKAALVEYLSVFKDDLDEDSQRRLDSNPLRILDSKSEKTQAILVNAPDLHDFLDDESKQDFQQLCQMLDAVDIRYTVNNRLVRGLDYYNKTVFEWVTTDLGAQGTICAGGRYDSLVEQLGGKSVPAVGFAMGVERLNLLLDTVNPIQNDPQQVDVYFIISGDNATVRQAMVMAENLRQAMPQLKMISHCGGGSFKSQMKKADKSGAKIALIAGSDEVEKSEVSIKPLRGEFGEGQKTVAVQDLASLLTSMLSDK
ncbi:MAG: histidine--tRNA ligase [Pseudomonadales bacterium]|nr:histidine--tRNA ligase [Pseudomonadales bacterium]